MEKAEKNTPKDPQLARKYSAIAESAVPIIVLLLVGIPEIGPLAWSAARFKNDANRTQFFLFEDSLRRSFLRGGGIY